MTTLTEFLLARIAEDEAELGTLMVRDEGAGPNGLGWAEVGAISEVLMTSHARALRECQAKRQIIARYDGCDDCGGSDDPCAALLAIGSVYGDHPDYRDEWR